MTPEDLLNSLQAMQARSQDPSPVLRSIADLMTASVDRNFKAEGRPAWPKVAKATARRKEKAGKSRILMWSGDLARSVVTQVEGNTIVQGSNWPYARIHNQGGIIEREGKSGAVRLRTTASGHLMRQGKDGKAANLAVFASGSHKRYIERAFTHGAYQIHMPARTFLVFQPGEPERYSAMISDYVLTGRIQEPA